MAENLNYGNLIPVTDSSYDNGIVEKYMYLDDSKSRSEFGGYETYYYWKELINYDPDNQQGICPDGWEIPAREDWELIIESGMFLIQYFGSGGFSNLNLTLSGVQPVCQPWDIRSSSPFEGNWYYFTNNYYSAWFNGHDEWIPYVASSAELVGRGHIFPVKFVNESTVNHLGIAPVRCIKRQ